MKRLFALTVAILALCVLLPSSAHATGIYPSPYGCANGPGGWESGLSGGTYINDGSIYGLAWGVTTVNTHFADPDGCVGADEVHTAAQMDTRYQVIRKFFGEWVFCWAGDKQQNGVSQQAYSFAMAAQSGQPCRTPGWPAGDTITIFQGWYQSWYGGPIRQYVWWLSS